MNIVRNMSEAYNIAYTCVVQHKQLADRLQRSNVSFEVIKNPQISDSIMIKLTSNILESFHSQTKVVSDGLTDYLEHKLTRMTAGNFLLDTTRKISEDVKTTKQFVHNYYLVTWPHVVMTQRDAIVSAFMYMTKLYRAFNVYCAPTSIKKYKSATNSFFMYNFLSYPETEAENFLEHYVKMNADKFIDALSRDESDIISFDNVNITMHVDDMKSLHEVTRNARLFIMEFPTSNSKLQAELTSLEWQSEAMRRLIAEYSDSVLINDRLVIYRIVRECVYFYVYV
jgi:hypothetical protein